MNAYDRIYLDNARETMGSMLDHAVNCLKIGLGDFFDLFIATGISDLFEKGDPDTVAGHSGIELSHIVLEEAGIPRKLKKVRPEFGKSREYWTGWALSYYQWKSCRTFYEIDRSVPVEEIREMYSPYHEMDINAFADELDSIFSLKVPETALARIRKYAELSQSMLSDISGVPVRTIQQYEQRQKDIKKAGAENLASLAYALHTDIRALLQ